MPQKLKPKADRAERVLQQLCRALVGLHASAGREWITVDTLHKKLDTLSDEQFDLAISVAVDRGWLRGAGRPPHTVQLTHLGRDACQQASAERRKK